MSFLLEVLDDPHFATGEYVVTRRAPATTDGNGRTVPGAASTFSIVASVQPVSGHELEVLPEASHGREVKLVLTVTRIDIARADQAADVVTIDGDPWTVVMAEHWEGFDGERWTKAHVAKGTLP